MELSELKKQLYKQKVLAAFTHANKDGLHYSTRIEDKSEGYIDIHFSVPFDDIGDGNFNNELPSQLLIRYMVYAAN